MNSEIILSALGVALLVVIFVAIFQLRNDIRHTNLTLDKIAAKIGVPDPLEDDNLKAFIKEGKKIEAIKRYREITGMSLKEANDLIESLM